MQEESKIAPPKASQACFPRCAFRAVISKHRRDPSTSLMGSSTSSFVRTPNWSISLEESSWTPSYESDTEEAPMTETEREDSETLTSEEELLDFQQSRPDEWLYGEASEDNFDDKE